MTAHEIKLPNRNLVGDLWGGLAAMLVALPSAIAFGVAIYSPLGGSLAAQGALAGILGAMALGLVAPLFGGSTRLITAPCAPAAAVLSALAVGFAKEGMAPGLALLLLGLIGIMAGGIQIALGLARVGQLIKFIPFPVVSGYLSGVGLIIIGSQIPKFLGAPGGAGLLDALAMPAAWRWQSVVVGTVVIIAMLVTPRLTKAVPAAILALLAGIAAYLLLALGDPALLNTVGNPLLVGSLGGGDSNLSDAVTQRWHAMSGLGLGLVVKVAVPALTLAALLSIDTLKTCVVIDAMTNSHHNSNRELMGQGLGNMAASLIGGIPGAGTMGASLINISSGGNSKFSGLLAGLFSLAAFLLLSPLIAWVPVAALAAILMVIGFRMIDRHSLAFFFTRSTRFDFLVILSVILVAIFGSLIAASGVGVALAILLFIREQTRSSVVRHRIEGNEIFSKRSRSRQDMEKLEREGSETVVFELQGSLFFGTASQLHTALEPEVGHRKFVILSMRRVQSLDITATHVLEQIKDRLEETDAYLVFCDIPKGLPSGLKMKRFLKDTGVVRPTNKAFAFRQLDEALEWVEAQKLEQLPVDQSEVKPLELRDMRVFAKCSDAEMTALESIIQTQSFKPDKKVFKAGEGDDGLFLVRRGAVKILVPIHKKENYHMTTCGPGDIMGGMGFVEDRGHVADGLALTDTDVFVLPRAGFDELAKTHPRLALTIIEAVAVGLSSRLRVTISELQALRG
ncbi:sulfate permease and related transporter [Paramagnetospirillum kuznetsovii]|uniref:Sulfate permease and related transporter n=1 Tax=Paramagnetospirillum kuznetsovii TaxID=2053833 RepID=A0A364P1E6_9PROT|nr:SulP family inorganic anion transporter [Paramagnetospirillum kuznetsovii]RAU23168.1 sulfate permease and related transporter [Paramagnetospirillum kuznetsovii]